MEQKTYTCKHHGELSPELVINRIRNNIRNNADGTKKRSPGCRLCKRKIDNLCQRNKTKQLSDSYIKRVLRQSSRVMEITPKVIEDTRERLQRLREAKANFMKWCTSGCAFVPPSQRRGEVAQTDGST